MLIYITWDAYNILDGEQHRSRVHLVDLPPDEIPKTRPLNRYTYDTFTTLCGHTTSMLTEVHRVASWLDRPCLKCKAIRSEKDSKPTSSHNARTKSQPTAQQHSNVLPSESDR